MYHVLSMHLTLTNKTFTNYYKNLSKPKHTHTHTHTDIPTCIKNIC